MGGLSARQLLWLFLRLNGRISRAAYLLAGLLANLVPGFLLYRFTLAPVESQAADSWAVAFFLIGLLSVWSIFALSVKRVHDLGKPGPYALALFVPVISYVVFIVLCVMPGDPAPNRYGAETNSPG
ncbi:DUF805 domain-containing protein [Mesorhizobium australicum]|uniref:Uncharacterized membrane protein YhaH, DUF805 family n=1 Tax=Mesorhizobium australicum TaxID=536018 RepID=A0A1X7NIK7_9HYPH|nr:DUF805 domain-containing protein [Mesorhizobium australicum]SMH37664.1 Uncharacterized membrane protein YhaH, DUF805 family [Mesorhizobium australicum]